MIRFFLRILFGVDMIFAMILYVVFSLIYQNYDFTLLLWSIFFAHLPDVSMAIYPFCKKWVINKFGIPSHRPLTHHPVLLISAIAISCYFLAPVLGYSISMFILLAVSNLFVHFVHDSIEPQGMHWISPFSWKRITLKNGFPEYVPENIWHDIHWEKEKKYAMSSKDEFTQRADKVSVVQKIAWGIIVLITVIYCLS